MGPPVPQAVVRPFLDSGSVWLIWLATVLAAILPERINLVHRRRAGATVRDRGSRLLFVPCVCGGVILISFSRRIVPGAMIRPTIVPFLIGELLFLGGAVLRWWSIRTLGELFTTTVQTSEDQPIVEEGPYRVLRHPSYTGLLLYALGAGFVSGNWFGLGAMTAAMLVALVYRIRIEEAALSDVRGEAYARFAATRKRLVPGIW